jgi:hypothetical protein
VEFSFCEGAGGDSPRAAEQQEKQEKQEKQRSHQLRDAVEALVKEATAAKDSAAARATSTADKHTELSERAAKAEAANEELKAQKMSLELKIEGLKTAARVSREEVATITAQMEVLAVKKSDLEVRLQHAMSSTAATAESHALNSASEVQVLEEENIDLMRENKDLRLEISRLRIAHDMAVSSGGGAADHRLGAAVTASSSSTIIAIATATATLPPLPPTPSSSSSSAENEVGGFTNSSMSKPSIIEGVTASGTKRAFGTELDGNTLHANSNNGSSNGSGSDAAPGSVLKIINSFDSTAASAATSRRSKVKVNTAGSAAAQPATAVGSGDGAQECNQS